MANIVSLAGSPIDQPPVSFIEFSSVGKVFRTKADERVEAIRDVSFTVAKNQFITVVGPSGCGKSTLLKMLAGLMTPTSGQIIVQSDDHKAGVTAGMVFQRPALLPWRNVLGNILLPAIITGMDREQALDRAHSLLTLVGLTDFANSYPSELSGGMQQRAAICRALLCQPKLLLMDEPFAALDALTREDLSIELLRIWQHEPKTVLFVTHSISEAILLADRVVIFSPRPGRVVCILDIDIARPRDLATTQTSIFQDYSAQIRAAIGARPFRGDMVSAHVRTE
jgi:NitT/TauT family transport system ATP-binding protein